jgi:hypothetical protein
LSPPGKLTLWNRIFCAKKFSFSHKSRESEVYGPPQISKIQLRAALTELEPPNQADTLTLLQQKFEMRPGWGAKTKIDVSILYFAGDPSLTLELAGPS